MNSWVEAVPQLPALVTGHVSHERFEAKNHAFRYAHAMWLVDLADLPTASRWGSFEARDHLGAGDDIRANLTEFVRVNGADIAPTDRVLMLANPRSLGYAFNPLSVFWVMNSVGRVTCLVAEIHNTYGERHAHLILPPDGVPHAAEGVRATVAKEFYVSPFFDVSGEYRMTFGLTPGSIRVGITLRRAGRVVFTASFAGSPQPVTRTNLLRHALRTYTAAHRTTALIRLHGIWLWARGLPVIPRSPHETPKAV